MQTIFSQTTLTLWYEYGMTQNWCLLDVTETSSGWLIHQYVIYSVFNNTVCPSILKSFISLVASSFNVLYELQSVAYRINLF